MVERKGKEFFNRLKKEASLPRRSKLGWKRPGLGDDDGQRDRSLRSLAEAVSCWPE